jgi:spermidine/putrescine transport system substrate-binding protein
MRNCFLGGISALALLTTASISQAAGNLSVYHWFEYIPQELVDKFSKQYDVKVTVDTYNSNEAMLAALKAGKLGAYDVAVPTDYMVGIMQGEGMLDTLKDGELSNKGNIAQQWLDVPFDMGRKSSIPYQIGTTAFMVNRDVYKGEINSLGVLFDPPAELKGKINVLDSQGEVLALGSMYLGIPQCSTDKEQLKKLNDLVLGAKANWASFGSDIAKDVLVSGDASAGMIYNGFGAKARGENAKLEYAYPKEGYVLWMDSVVLLKDAPNRDNAIKFMNFLLEPENAAAVTNYAQYMAGVTGAEKFYSDVVKNAPELNPPATQKGDFVMACGPEVQVLYDAIWTNLKK